MNIRKIALVTAAALAGSLLIIPANSQAQPGHGDVVIQKHIAPMTRYVSFADLELGTKHGQKVLFQRVGQAVGQVCPDVDEDGVVYDIIGCKDFAWRGARPQIYRAIDLAKSGMPLPAAVAISAASE